MRHWSRNDKFAFVGILLALVGLVSALFGQEIRRGMGLDPPQTVTQASVAPPLSPASVPPVNVKTAEVAVDINGDGNTVTVIPSSVPNPDLDNEVNADGGQSDFPLGPHQTARIDLKGDGNTLRVAPKLRERVTIVNDGDGNKIVH